MAFVVFTKGFERELHRHSDPDVLEVYARNLTHDPNTLGEIDISECVWHLKGRG